MLSAADLRSICSRYSVCSIMRSILTAGDSPSLRSSSNMNPSLGMAAAPDAVAAPLNASAQQPPRLARALRRSISREGSRKARESPSASRASAIRLMGEEGRARGGWCRRAGHQPTQRAEEEYRASDHDSSRPPPRDHAATERSVLITPKLSCISPPHSQPRALRHVTISHTSQETPKSRAHED